MYNNIARLINNQANRAQVKILHEFGRLDPRTLSTRCGLSTNIILVVIVINVASLLVVLTALGLAFLFLLAAAADAEDHAADHTNCTDNNHGEPDRISLTCNNINITVHILIRCASSYLDPLAERVDESTVELSFHLKLLL